MTSIKEALEQIIQVYDRNIGRQNEKLADIKMIAHSALTQLDSADARSTVARALCCPDGCVRDGDCWSHLSKERSKQVDAILSTGLLPDASPGNGATVDQILRSVKMQAVGQVAILNHPFYEGGASSAFGYSGAVLAAVAEAIAKGEYDDLPPLGDSKRPGNGAEKVREAALRLLVAEDNRQTRLHEILETIREQIRTGVEPEHRPDGLFKNIQDAVYAMRGRTPLMDDMAILASLHSTSAAGETTSSDGLREQEETATALEAGNNPVRKAGIGPLPCGESPASPLPSETHKTGDV